MAGQTLRNAIISKELKSVLRTLEVVFGISPRGTAMAMIAENAYVQAGDFDRNYKRGDQQPAARGRGSKLNPSPAVAVINLALQQSRTGHACINWDMVVRSLLGLYSAAGEYVTYVNKTNGIGFSAAVEEKNVLALREPRELPPAKTQKSCCPSSTRSAGANIGAAPHASSRAAAPTASRRRAWLGGFSP